MAFRVTRASVTTDPGLDDIASLEASAGDIIVASGVDDYSLQSTTTAGRTVLALGNPGADRIAFWDDSGSAFGWLTLGSGISISGTTLDVGVGGDLGALESLSGTGFAARIGTDTWAQRTITGTADELTVTNGNGVSGNPTISLPSAMTLTGKTLTGGTFSGPTLSGTVAGTPTFSGAVTFSGNPVISGTVPRLTIIETDAPANETVWSFASAAGNLLLQARSDDLGTSTTAILLQRSGATVDEIELNATTIDVNATMDVSGALTVASVAVPTISSSDTLSNKTLSSPTITGTIAGTPAIASAWAFSTSPTVPTPTNSTDAANKAYVDSVAVGLSVKTAVACATTANITLSGEQTIDGISTSASRVLVKDQSTASQNGVYVSAAGAWSRATDLDVWSEAIGALVAVTAGTVNANRIYVSTAAAGGTIGTTSLTFTLFINTSGLQPLDSDLTAIAALTTTSYGRSLLEAANAAALRTLAGTVIGTDVQAYSAVLAATTASFLTADETKLDGIEALADVTDATNVAAAGALMTSSLAANVETFLGTPSSANLRAALTDETGTGAAVFATSPALVTPDLGTPSALTLTNATGLPISTGVSGLGANVSTFLETASSANLRTAMTDETGTGSLVFATSPTLVTPALGTPSAVVLTNGTGLPIAGLTGLGTGIASFLATPSSANLATAITDETGSGALVFGTSPTLATPSLTSPTIAGAALSGTLSGTPTFSGVITFTATTGPLISSTAPRLRFYETDAATDEKEWAILTNGGLFTIFPYDDAGGAGSTAAVRINRTGTVVDEVELNATALDFNGALDLSGAAVFGSTASFAGAVTASTTIELGNTSDTTLSRASAGQVAIEGVQIATASNSLALANKSVTATGGSVSRTFESRFAAEVDVLDHCATVDGSTNNTTGIAAAIALGASTGRTIRFRAQTAAYITDTITISTAGTKIIIEAGATVKLRSGAAAFTTSPATQSTLAVFFVTASNVEIILDGIIDFNRSAFLSSYNTAAGSTSLRYHAVYVFAYNGSPGGGTLTGFTLRGFGKIINSIDAAVLTWHADEVNVSQITCEDCGAAPQFWAGNKIRANFLTLKNIDNAGAECYQHAVDFFGCTDVVCLGLRIIDQTSDDSASGNGIGYSDFFSGVTISACRDLLMDDFQIIAKQDTDCIIPLGLSVVGCRNAHFSNGRIERFAQCSIEDGGNDNCSFTNIICDGGLDTTGAYFKQTIGTTITAGVVIHDGFKYTDPSATGTAGHSLNSPARGSKYTNVVVRRQLGSGFRVWSGVDAVLDNCEAYGCQDGFRILKPNDNTAFPASTDIGVRRLTLNNCRFNYNERYGIHPDFGDDVNVIDCEMINNGQSVGLGLRNGGAAVSIGAGYYGAATASGVVARSKWRFKNPRVYDDQTRTADLGSADPATPNQIRLYPISRYKVGQTIILSGCGTAGADLTARINEIDFQTVTLDRDLVTFPTISGTGTISSSGTAITGSGTNFNPELAVFGQFIRADGEYREIVKVNSDTSAQVISAFTAPLSADTFTIVQFEVDQVPCQDYGFDIDPLDENFQIDDPDWGPGNQTANILDGSNAATAVTVKTRFSAISKSSAEWEVNSGSPAITAYGGSRYQGWAFDGAADELITTETWLPEYNPRSWTPRILWVNAGAGSGNVVWRLEYGYSNAGDTMGAYVGNESITATAGAQDVRVQSTFSNITLVPGRSVHFRLTRLGTNGSDTLANDAIFDLFRLDPN